VVRISNNTKREVLGTSKITHKFQVTVPKEVRRRFKLEKGETLVFLEEEDKLVVKKSTEI